MRSKPSARSTATGGEASSLLAEVEYWKQRAGTLPDVRRDRILAARTAILGDHYNADEVLEATVDRLHRDIADSQTVPDPGSNASPTNPS